MKDLEKIGHEPGSKAGPGSYKSYTLGFALALILSLFSFACVMLGLLPRSEVIIAIVAAAILQVCVHLFFFLHMSRSSTPRWNIIVFAFAMIVIAILIGGTVWIMYSADQQMIPGSGAMDM
jgi:cytochrome o ubiquinol oxidase operon protein cyoD